MIRRLMIRLVLLSLGALALAGTGCRRESVETTRSLGFDAFLPVYNRHIESWLKSRQAETEKELAKVESELATAAGPAADRIRSHADSLRLDQEKWRFRLSLGDYLKI